MTEEELEREYYGRRPTEPYSEDDSPNDWANIVQYAEENLNKAFTSIAELEEKISVLLSCKNCSENKGGWICVKEYENKCLAQKIEFIKELEKEKCELLGIVQGKDKVIQELKKELNKANEWHEIESKVTPKREISKQYMPKNKEKVLLKYHFSGDDEIHISDGYYDAYDFEFHIANNPKFRIVCVIAWKEIGLPKGDKRK